MADYIGTITMRSGDQLPLLAMVIEDDMGTPVDLTGATTADIILRHEDGRDPRVDPDRPMPTLTLPGYVTDPPHGLVVYDWDPNLLLRPGALQLTLHVAVAAGGYVTAPTDRSAWIFVRPNVDIFQGGDMPGRYDLNLYRGDSYTWQFRLWTDAARTVPLDLAGASVAAQIRDRPGGFVMVPFSCDVTLPNIVLMSLTPENSQRCPANGAWDMQITYPSGDVKTAVAGTVFTTPDVTVTSPVFSYSLGVST